jgi:hypothetical protein
MALQHLYPCLILTILKITVQDSVNKKPRYGTGALVIFLIETNNSKAAPKS